VSSRKLGEEVDRLKDFAARVLEELISIPTVNPPGERYEDMANYLSDLLKGMGFDVRVLRVPRDYVAKHYPEYADYPRFNVVARLGSGERPILHFNGHYDVVPPGSGWSSDPFKPKFSEGKVYGRGASDMKGGIASILLMAKALSETGLNLRGTIELSFTPDEEIGGNTGVGYLLEEGVVKPDYAIVAEPSGLDAIWIGNKGLVWLLVEVFGRQAHGSTPWRGVNAFEHMVYLASRILNELKPKIESRLSRYEYDEVEGRKATINLGGEVRGSTKVNIVPGYYAFSIDRRVLPEESVEDAEREIVEFVEMVKSERPGLNARVKVLSKSEPAVIDPNHPFVETLAKSIEEVVGVKPRRTVCMGGLDTRYFQVKGIPSATYGPGLSSLAHAPDEYVELDHVVAAAKVYSRVVELILGTR